MPARRNTRTLTLTQVVDAALELLEAGGPEAVTIRAVAGRCNVSAMTLYTYVRSKEELLAAVSGRLLDDMEAPDPSLPWEERIAVTFRSAREVFLHHPELARIAAMQPVDGIAAYRGAEVVLAALSEAGLAGDESVQAFEALSAFVVGHTLREAARSTAEVPRAQRHREIRALPEAEFPHVRAVAAPFVQRDADTTFEAGLRLLIRGIVDSAVAARPEHGVHAGPAPGDSGSPTRGPRLSGPSSAASG